MTEELIARRAPEPIPAIHPVAEFRVEGERRQFYEEMKSALQVPWMGVVTMAYAHYPDFFRTLWHGLRPVVASEAFVRHGQELRAMVEYEVGGLEPANLCASMGELGYAPRELGQIRQMIEIFSHGNFPYLMIAALVRLLLEGHELEGPEGLDARPFDGRHAPRVDVPLVLMEAHHADAPTRALYVDIQQTLGLPFVNTDYRALARWPSYFSRAWAGLRPVVGGAAHEAVCERVHREAVRRVRRELPNPAGLTARALRAAAQRDAPLVEVLRVAQLFQWLLPGLVTNVAFFRAQLVEA